MSQILRNLKILVSADISAAQKGFNSLSKDMKKAGKDITATGKSLTKEVTVPILAMGAAATVAAMDFESAFAGVEKTVDGTTSQMAALEQGIRDMAKEIPASAVEIASVAEAAGQLGIQTENILDFTRVMTDLGNATNLTSTEGATQLARFANIMQMSQTKFSNLGSAIVDLGNNFATTEAEITAMSLRLAGAGKQVGMTESDILGIATALSSVGIEAEAGGSALSRVMVDMQLAVANGEVALDNFASVAGMSASDFAKAYREDAASALVAFVTGLGSMKESGQDAIVVLEEMGIDQIRMRDALLRLAGAGDILSTAIDTSNTAWTENIALNKEAEKRYATSESKLKIQKQLLTDVGITIGEKLLPTVVSLAEAAVKGLSVLEKVDPKLLLMVAAIGPTVFAIGKLTTGFGVLTGKISATMKVISGGGGFLAGLKTLVGPQGIAVMAVAAIAAVTYGIMALTQEARDASKKVSELVDSVKASRQAYADKRYEIEANADAANKLIDEIDELSRKEDKSAGEKEKLRNLVAELNALYPEMNVQIDEQTGLIDKNANSLKNLVKVQKETILAQADMERWVAIQKEQYTVSDKIAATQMQLADMTHKNLKEFITSMLPWMGIAQNEEARLAFESLKKLQTELDLLEREFGLVEGRINQTAESIVQDNREMGKSTEEFAEAAKQNYDTAAGAVEESNERAESSNEISSEKYKKYLSEMESAKKDYIDQMGALDDEGIKKTKLTAAEVKKNLEKQIEDFQNWRASIQELSARVPSDVMQELRSLGPEFAPVIAELVNMTDEELADWVDVWTTKSQEAELAARDEIGSFKDWMFKEGSTAGFYFAEGIDTSLAAIKAAARRATGAAAIGPVTYTSSSLGKLSTTVGMESYATGTDRVPRTGPAILHEGEGVLTKEENKAYQAGKSGVTININGPISSERDADYYGEAIVRKLRTAGVVV